METSLMEMRAIFRCTKCKQQRPWGHDKPEDPKYKPVLNCGHCGEATRHEYLERRESYAS